MLAAASLFGGMIFFPSVVAPQVFRTLDPVSAGAFGMIFFPSVVAPQVFRTLDPVSAGAFLRRLFPWYYGYMIATSSVGAIAGIFVAPALAAALFGIMVTTIPIRQVLTPQLNRWRDAELEHGDLKAGQNFKFWHRVSVIINLMQLIIILSVLIVWTTMG